MSSSDNKRTQGFPWSSRDWCTREGAIALKAMIEAFWRARGKAVQIMLHPVGYVPAVRSARFDVRSDMVDALPVRDLKQEAA